jgi:hypothetical protein
MHDVEELTFLYGMRRQIGGTGYSADVVRKLEVDQEQLLEGRRRSDFVRPAFAVTLIDEELVLVDRQDLGCSPPMIRPDRISSPP